MSMHCTPKDPHQDTSSNRRKTQVEPLDEFDLEWVSIRIGAGSPHASTPRSERQYEGD